MFGNNKKISIELSETITRNFQSKKCGFQFELPKGILFREGMELARFLINFEMTGTYDPQDRQRLNHVFEAIFGEPLTDYLETKYAPVQNRKSSGKSRKVPSGDGSDFRGTDDCPF